MPAVGIFGKGPRQPAVKSAGGLKDKAGFPPENQLHLMHILSFSSNNTKQDMQQPRDTGKSLRAGDLQCSHCKSLHSSGVCTISAWQRAWALIVTSIQSLMIFRAQTKSSDGAVALTCPHTPDLDVLGTRGGNVPQKWHFEGKIWLSELWEGWQKLIQWGRLNRLGVSTISGVNWVSLDQFYCKGDPCCS